jgi:hypothetical protein
VSAAADAGAAIRPQPTGARPRLETDSNGSAHAPPPPAAAPPSAPNLPPPFQAAPAPVAPEPVGNTPEAAALLIVAAHNIAGCALLAIKAQPAPVLEAWIAEPRELDAAAPALARTLDSIGIHIGDGGEGLIGKVVDGVMCLGAIGGMELRHVNEVRKAQERVARAQLAAETAPPAAQAGQPTPPPPPPPAVRPTVVQGGRAPAPAPPPTESEVATGFHFPPDLAAFVNAQPEHGAAGAFMEETKPT